VIIFTHALDGPQNGAPEQDDPFLAHAKACGMQASLVPLIKTAAMPFEVSSLKNSNGGFVVTSKRGVEFGLSHIVDKSARIYALEGRTKQAAEALGFKVSGRGTSAAQLAKSLLNDSSVVWPLTFLCAESTTGELESACNSAQKKLTRVPCYRTTDCAPRVNLKELAPSWFVFASPSAFNSSELYIDRAILKAAQLLAIGPTTAAAIHKAGFNCITALEPSPVGVVAAIQSVLE